MTTIDFLFQLHTEHFYRSGLRSGLSNLDAFLCDFDCLQVPVIEKFTSRLNLTKEKFLIKLVQDLNAATSEEIIKLANIIEDSIYARNNQLLSCIRKAIYCYAVRNPEFDIDKYLKTFILGAVNDIRADLHADVFVSFNEEAKNKHVYAETDVDHFNENDPHIFNIYVNSFKGSRERKIFAILTALYHEEYHALVNEMQINPNCFKLDILQYQKEKVCHNLLDKAKFYERNYEYLHEEAEADIFSIHRAIKKIQELNPKFPFFKILVEKTFTLLFATESQFSTIFRTEFNKKVEQKKFVDNQLDVLLPNNPESVYGMLSRVYNQDGSRKDFKTLIIEYIETLNKNKEVPKEEIEEFYIELLYRAYNKTSVNEKEKLMQDTYYSYFVIQCLKKKERSLQKELINLKNKKVMSLTGISKKESTKFLKLKELKQVREEQKILRREETVSYGL